MCKDQPVQFEGLGMAIIVFAQEFPCWHIFLIWSAVASQTPRETRKSRGQGVSGVPTDPRLFAVKSFGRILARASLEWQCLPGQVLLSWCGQDPHYLLPLFKSAACAAPHPRSYHCSRVQTGLVGR